MGGRFETDGGEERRLLGAECVAPFDAADPERQQPPSGGGGDDDDADVVCADSALQRIGFGRFQYSLCAALGWALSADAVETLAVSFLLPFAMCELQATSLDKGALSAVGFAGMLVGSLLWGPIADGIGRQRALLWCQSMNALFSIASSFSQSFTQLVATRLLSGIGVGGTLPLLSVYFMEFLPLKKRGRWMGFFASFWMIGQFLVSGLAWAVLPRADWDFSPGGFRFNSWRIFLLMASVPCLTSAVMFLAFPESPSYLIQKGHSDEAMKVFRRICAVNAKSRGSAGSTPTFVLARAPMSAAAVTTRHLAGVTGFLKGATARTVLLFTNRRHRMSFLLSSAVLFCVGFSSYGLSVWFPELFRRMQLGSSTSICSVVPSQSASDDDGCGDAGGSVVRDADAVFVDAFLQAVALLPGNLGFLYLVGIVGQKVILGVSLITSGAMVFLIWFVTSHAAGVVMAMSFTAINTFSWNSMTVMVPELFSTDVRSTAQGLQTAVVRLASILANVMVGALIDAQCSLAMLLLGGVLVVGGLVSSLLPDAAKQQQLR